jgi:threonine dehydrogenase-like Zn-dependent dehydrogenase
MRNHQEFVTAKASMSDNFPALPLPESVDWDLAPFCIWGRSCINWSRRANVQLDENVAIVGCGLVGLLMTMFTRLQNPKSIIAVDLVPERRELALRCGADYVAGGEDNHVEKVLELSRGGADVTLHCVGGAAVRSFETSQRITRSGGRTILIGHHMEALTVLPGQYTGKDLLGANVGYDYNPGLFLDGIRLIEQGKLPMKEIITHNVPYTEGPAIYDMLINDPGQSVGVLFRWD